MERATVAEMREVRCPASGPLTGGKMRSAGHGCIGSGHYQRIVAGGARVVWLTKLERAAAESLLVV